MPPYALTLRLSLALWQTIQWGCLRMQLPQQLSAGAGCKGEGVVNRGGWGGVVVLRG